MPFWFPANRKQYLNGTRFDDDILPKGLFLVGFQGTVSDVEYNRLLSQTHFGKKTPIDFPGYNPSTSPTGFFPFWSSDAYTYSTTMLAFAKYVKIHWFSDVDIVTKIVYVFLRIYLKNKSFLVYVISFYHCNHWNLCDNFFTWCIFKFV